MHNRVTRFEGDAVTIRTFTHLILLSAMHIEMQNTYLMKKIMLPGELFTMEVYLVVFLRYSCYKDILNAISSSIHNLLLESKGSDQVHQPSNRRLRNNYRKVSSI